MRKIVPVVVILFTVFGLKSCSTDFSVNGAYKITPIVIGLLDQNDTAHIIKITKAFLGDDDNLIYAQNPDSNYFNSVDAWVSEINPLTDEPTGRTWNLHDSIITDKSTNGVFYAPEQKVYVFYADDLDESMDYELTADVDEGTYSFNARTSLLSNFTVQSTILTGYFKVNFAAATIAKDDDYKNWRFTVSEANNASRYNYKYIFHWREFYADGSQQDFSATRNDGDVTQDKPDQPSAQTQSFSGLDFYKWVADVVPDDPDVIKRQMLGLDLRISVAHKDLDQYMQVGAPVTGIVQTKPEYTNVNGGLGLFSSRLIFEVDNYRIDKNSIKELCKGQYTVTKLFCSQYPEDATESYACP